MDIFASLTLMRPPKYLSFYRRLLVGGNGFWNNDNDLRMEGLTGIPDEVLLAIANISALAAWKAQELRNGSLSVRELIRRGDDIEQHLRQHCAEPAGFFAERDQVPLHPSLPNISVTQAHGASDTSADASSPLSLHTTRQFPNEDMRRLVAGLFREAAVLYLHTVLSDCNPGKGLRTYLVIQADSRAACLGVPEIATSVENIIQLINQLPPSEVDRCLIFPICLAGCLSDNASHRELLKGRLQAQDQNIGNLLQTRAVMEAVWQGRDVQGGVAVCWREAIRERGINILLV
jgi:C6 transcription factor Pro1